MTSFSSVQMTLLSNECPKTMSRPAFSMSAVPSTMAGGLPGPAQMALLPEFIAAATTAPPPVTTRRRILGCFISSPADLNRRLGRAGDRVRRPSGPDDRRVEKTDRLLGDSLGRRVRVEHDRVSRSHHADGVADDRGRGIRDRSDRPDDAEWRGLDEGEAVIPRGGLRRELLGAGSLVRDEEVLLDLVLHAAEARLLDGKSREGTRVLAHRLAHRLDDRVPFLEAERVEAPERGATPQRPRRRASRKRRLRGRRRRRGDRGRTARRGLAFPSATSSRAISSARRRISSGLDGAHRRTRARTSSSRRASGRRSPTCPRSP